MSTPQVVTWAGPMGCPEPVPTTSPPSAVPSSSSPRAGQTTEVGPYRLLRLLGSGAMGHVYEAEHVLLGRHVALKILRPELAQHRELVGRFFDEARATNLIDSAHIVQVTDLCFDPDGQTYLVMERLQGESLADVCARGPLPVLRALELARQLCDALDAAHEAGVVHRDLKPENVFVCPCPCGEQVKLLDFGIAQLRDHSRGAGTMPGVVLGTPEYMAPEQALGHGVDLRSDLYSLGVLLGELLSGQPPSTSTGGRAGRAPELPDLSELPTRVRQPLEALLVRCLQSDPEARPQSAREAARALDRALEGLHTSSDGASLQLTPHGASRDRPHAITARVPLPAAASAGGAARRRSWLQGLRRHAGWLVTAIGLALLVSSQW